MAIRAQDVKGGRSYHRWTAAEDQRVRDVCLKLASQASSITEIAVQLANELNDTTTGVLRRIAKLRKEHPELDAALQRFSRRPEETAPGPQATPAVAPQGPGNVRVARFLMSQAECILGPLSDGDVRDIEEMLRTFGEAEVACGLMYVMTQRKQILFSAWRDYVGA